MIYISNSWKEKLGFIIYFQYNCSWPLRIVLQNPQVSILLLLYTTRTSKYTVFKARNALNFQAIYWKDLYLLPVIARKNIMAWQFTATGGIIAKKAATKWRKRWNCRCNCFCRILQMQKFARRKFNGKTFCSAQRPIHEWRFARKGVLHVLNRFDACYE